MSFCVLMSVYKNENPEYLDRALKSVWFDQTLRPDQIVLVRDGPVPHELEAVIEHWSKRLSNLLTIVRLATNQGLHGALNAGLEYCLHDLVARMDTDDISMPNRFEIQVAFMNEHTDVAASSGQLEEWDEQLARRLAVRRLPVDTKALARFARKRSPLSHPAAIFRRVTIHGVGGYPDLPHAEDYALWSRLLVDAHRLANVPDVLLKMRCGDEMFGRRGGWRYFKQQVALLRYQLRIGFLNRYEFYRNLCIQAVLRLAPRFVKRWMYKILR